LGKPFQAHFSSLEGCSTVLYSVVDHLSLAATLGTLVSSMHTTESTAVNLAFSREATSNHVRGCGMQPEREIPLKLCSLTSRIPELLICQHVELRASKHGSANSAV